MPHVRWPDMRKRATMPCTPSGRRRIESDHRSWIDGTGTAQCGDAACGSALAPGRWDAAGRPDASRPLAGHAEARNDAMHPERTETDRERSPLLDPRDWDRAVCRRGWWQRACTGPLVRGREARCLTSGGRTCGSAQRGHAPRADGDGSRAITGPRSTGWGPRGAPTRLVAARLHLEVGTRPGGPMPHVRWPDMRKRATRPCTPRRWWCPAGAGLAGWLGRRAGLVKARGPRCHPLQRGTVVVGGGQTSVVRVAGLTGGFGESARTAVAPLATRHDDGGRGLAPVVRGWLGRWAGLINGEGRGATPCNVGR
jgi:hypothetical protein